jgi:hypothetical protein
MIGIDGRVGPDMPSKTFVDSDDRGCSYNPAKTPIAFGKTHRHHLNKATRVQNRESLLDNIISSRTQGAWVRPK